MPHSHHRPSLLWPLLLLGFGALLLAQDFGLLPPDLWGALAQLWPVLLIVLGLDMLIGRRARGGALAVLGLGALALATALTWAAFRASALPPGTPRALEQFRGSARSASVALDLDLGRVTLTGIDDATRLMAGQVDPGRGEVVSQRYFLANEVGRLELSQDWEVLSTAWLVESNPSRWEVRLATDLPLTLTVRTGGGPANLDLSALQLSALTLHTGRAEAQVRFPAGWPVRASIVTGTGPATLIIPAEVPARVTVEEGAAVVRLPTRYLRDGNVYSTPGFSTTGAHVDIVLRAGVGTVTIR